MLPRTQAAQWWPWKPGGGRPTAVTFQVPVTEGAKNILDNNYNNLNTNTLLFKYDLTGRLGLGFSLWFRTGRSCLLEQITPSLQEATEMCAGAFSRSTGQVIQSHDFSYHDYFDDTQLLLLCSLSLPGMSGRPVFRHVLPPT